MKVGIHRDLNGKTNDKIDKYLSILDYNKIDFMLMDINEVNFWNQIKEIDYFIFRYSLYDDQKQIANDIIPVIEKYYNVKTFPDSNTCWSYDDKIRETFLLRNEDNVLVDSWIFYDKKNAIDYSSKLLYPVVFKLKGGSRSQNVILLKNKNDYKRIIKKIFGSGIYSERMYFKESTVIKDLSVKKIIKETALRIRRFINDEETKLYWTKQKNYILLQKFLPNNTYDTRITTIGDRIFGVRRFIRDGDFRASGSGKTDFNYEKVDTRMIEIAYRISKKYQFQTMAYDFIYDEKKNPKIVEMSYNYPDMPIEKAEGYWDKDFHFHKSKNCAEYYHLVDLLDLPNLKLPGNLILNKNH